jgi:thioredoxin 1
MSNLILLADERFDAEVVQSAKPVLVYFWATWCGPCRLTAPFIEQIANEQADRLKVVKMEVDASPTAVAACKIEGVPAFRLFMGGQQMASLEGALPKGKIEAFFTPYLS